MYQEDWFTVTKLNEDTFAISEYGHWEKVHSFLLIGKTSAVLIDTGLGISNIKEVVSTLTDKEILVLTTHVHTDHIGSHGEFSEIAVHEKDADWMVHGIQGLTIEQIRKDIARDITKPTPKNFNPKNYRPFTGKPSILLKDNDVISLGDRELRILHTPGHSPGHISILDEKHRFLFTGDLLYDQTPIYAFYPSTNPADLVDSLARISKLTNISKVFGSHNTLGLNPTLLIEAGHAAKYLRNHHLDHFGTGIHVFNGFSIRF